MSHKSANKYLFKNQQAGQKVNWDDVKKRNQELKKKRLLSNSNYKIIQTSKQLFEEIRRSNCPLEKRTAYLKKLKRLLRGKIMEVIKTHDMSRVIEWMLKLGTPDVYEFILEEIMDNLVIIAQSKYSSYVLKYAIRYCKTPSKRLLFKKLIDHTVRLISSKTAAPIMNKIYKQHALSEEKFRMRQSFYGELFKTLSVNEKVNITLKEICEKNTEFKQIILDATKTNIRKVLDKKWCLKTDVVTYVMNEYLELCNNNDKIELIEGLRPNVAELLKTKDGTKLAMTIVWNSNAKEKKQLVKQIQDEIVNVSKSNDGCMFLLWLIDSIDDTVLVKKVLLKKFNDNIEKLLNDNSGRKILVYIFDHRKTNSFFNKTCVEKLQEADTSEFVKKEKEVKISEIQEGCFGNIMEHMTRNPQIWLSNGPISLVTTTILNHTLNNVYKKEFESVFNSLSTYLCETENVPAETEGKENSESTCIIERSYIHLFIKKVIELDGNRHTVDLPTFTESILKVLNEDTVLKWIKFNRGCFTLIKMFQTNILSVKNTTLKILKNPPVFNCIMEMSSPGATNLQKILKEN